MTGKYKYITLPDHDVPFKILAQADFGGGYDWRLEAILERVDDGALFFASDGGCSCSGPWEYGVNLQPVDSVRAGLREASSDRYREALQRSYDQRGEIEHGDLY